MINILQRATGWRRGKRFSHNDLMIFPHSRVAESSGEVVLMTYLAQKPQDLIRLRHAHNEREENFTSGASRQLFQGNPANSVSQFNNTRIHKHESFLI